MYIRAISLEGVLLIAHLLYVSMYSKDTHAYTSRRRWRPSLLSSILYTMQHPSTLPAMYVLYIICVCTESFLCVESTRDKKRILQNIPSCVILFHAQENYVTPLTRCCSIGNETFETVDFLVSKGASVNGYQKVHIHSVHTFYIYMYMYMINQTSRRLNKAKQINSTRLRKSFPKKNWLPQVGFELTTFCSLDRVLCQLSY